MRVDFIKYEGLGNDFVLIDDRPERLRMGPATVTAMLDRHFGIGGDGMMLVRPAADVDARMVFYNPDGSEAEMCGNGVRAFAKYLYELGGVKKESIEIETGAGTKHVRLRVEQGRAVEATVDMGVPSFLACDVPVEIAAEEAIEVPMSAEDIDLIATCVSMGNPHCVTFWDDVSTAPVERLGRALEHSALFRERTNVEFAQVVERGRIKLRVWERGAGETLACGTGACAAAVAAARTGRTSRRVVVELPGGELRIDWAGDDRVMMTGPAREVFRGNLDLDSLAG